MFFPPINAIKSQSPLSDYFAPFRITEFHNIFSFYFWLFGILYCPILLSSQQCKIWKYFCYFRNPVDSFFSVREYLYELFFFFIFCKKKSPQSLVSIKLNKIHSNMTVKTNSFDWFCLFSLAKFTYHLYWKKIPRNLFILAFLMRYRSYQNKSNIIHISVFNKQH